MSHDLTPPPTTTVSIDAPLASALQFTHDQFCCEAEAPRGYLSSVTQDFGFPLTHEEKYEHDPFKVLLKNTTAAPLFNQMKGIDKNEYTFLHRLVDGVHRRQTEGEPNERITQTTWLMSTCFFCEASTREWHCVLFQITPEGTKNKFFCVRDVDLLFRDTKFKFRNNVLDGAYLDVKQEQHMTMFVGAALYVLSTTMTRDYTHPFWFNLLNFLKHSVEDELTTNPNRVGNKSEQVGPGKAYASVAEKYNAWRFRAASHVYTVLFSLAEKDAGVRNIVSSLPIMLGERLHVLDRIAIPEPLMNRNQLRYEDYAAQKPGGSFYSRCRFVPYVDLLNRT